MISCTGYIKTWMPAQIDFDDVENGNINIQSCLVAVGRIQQNISPCCGQDKNISNIAIQFIWRLTTEGRFSYVDQKLVYHSFCKYILFLACTFRFSCFL